VTASRVAHLVRALGGVASVEDARRILGDAHLRRTLDAAWSAEPPSVEMLARILRKSAQGNHGPLRLVEELHLGTPTRASRRTLGVIAALHRWCYSHGDLRWFTEISPVAHDRDRLVGDPVGAVAAGISCRWLAEHRVIEVDGAGVLAGQQVALLVGTAGAGVELVGPSGLRAQGERSRAVFAVPGHDPPRWAEPLTRPGRAGRRAEEI
jgi:hypothetical protein